jgi:hypothetical protein
MQDVTCFLPPKLQIPEFPTLKIGDMGRTLRADRAELMKVSIATMKIGMTIFS